MVKTFKAAAAAAIVVGLAAAAAVATAAAAVLRGGEDIQQRGRRVELETMKSRSTKTGFF